MAIKLKTIKEQVIVITGASSGIGLATAKMAAEQGAKVVLGSRNKEELDRIVQEISGKGGEALAVACDVADPQAVENLAQEALARFGRIDTWVNNAGLTIYGKLWESPLEEKRRLFDINFWGVVHGCRSATKIMKESGGAIINIGSVLSERAIPIQGIYSASKHAVKAYTDSLRMELEAEGFPISVTLIKPAAIDTPYTDHAVNRLDHHPVHTPPVYAPELVAHAIIECAQHSRRDLYIGGSGKFFSVLESLVPRLTDFIMEKGMMESGQSNEKLDDVKQEPALYGAPRKEGEVHGSYPGRVMKRSAYTAAALHPSVAALIAAGLGIAAAAGIGFLQNSRTPARTRQPEFTGNQLHH